MVTRGSEHSRKFVSPDIRWTTKAGRGGSSWVGRKEAEDWVPSTAASRSTLRARGCSFSDHLPLLNFPSGWKAYYNFEEATLGAYIVTRSKGANGGLWKTGRWVSQIPLHRRLCCLAVECDQQTLLMATKCQILQGLPLLQRTASPKGMSFLDNPHQVTRQGRV